MTGEIRCRRTYDGKTRCTWTGTRATIGDHARETGHWPCCVCHSSLSDTETQTCTRCIGRCRLDLVDIEHAYAMLPTVAEQRGYHTGSIPGGVATVLQAGGAPGGVVAGRATPDRITRPAVTYLQWPDTADTPHPAYVASERHPPGHDGGREAAAGAQWPSDPPSVLAVLVRNEDDWRNEFGHGAGREATVSGCVAYLQQWLDLAARTHPGFADYVTDIRAVKRALLVTTGTNDDPLRANVACFDCGGQLARRYREPVDAVERLRRGKDREGLEDDWGCLSCGGVYDQASYYLALRARLEAEAMVDTMAETEETG